MSIYNSTPVPNISYANTFGDWVVATNNLIIDQNNFASNNYQKTTGTLYLGDSTLGLQVNTAALVAGSFQVAGVGSSAQIQNNLTVTQGQVYFQNTTLGLTNAGQAIIQGQLQATGTGTSLAVSNNTTMGGTLGVSGVTTISNTVSISGATTIGGATTVSNTVSISGTTTVSNNLTVSQNTTVSHYLSVGNDISAYNQTLSGALVVPTATITNIQGTSANISTLAGQTISTSGTHYTNILQANSTVNTATATVAGTTYTNILTANTSLSTPKATVTTLIDANSAAAFVNSLQTIGQLSVGGNFVINGATVYNSNTFTLSAAATSGQYNSINVNRGTSGANASIRWNEPAQYWDLLDVGNSNYYRILTNEFVTDNVVSTSTTSVASANSVNALNNFAQTNVTNLQNQISSNVSSLQSQISSNVAIIAGVDLTQNTNISTLQSQTSYIAGVDATQNTNITATNTYATSAYGRANTSLNSITGTTGTSAPSSGSLTFASNNGIVISGQGSTVYVNDPQDIRTTASPTFNGLSLSTALPITSGGTGATSAGGALTSLLPSGTTSGYVLTTGGPGNFYWAAGGTGGGGGATPGTTISSSAQQYTANGSGAAYVTPVYVPGADQLKVYLDGVRQHPGQYSEVSGNTGGVGIVSFPAVIASGVAVLLEVDGYIVNPYYANNIAYTVNSNIGSSANTIQLAVDGLTSIVINNYANTLAPVTFSNTVSHTSLTTAPTPSTNTSNTQIATTAFVQNTLNSGNNFNLNAATVTNGVYTNGSYANPSWITSLANTKISGNIVSSQITSVANTQITGSLSSISVNTGNFTIYQSGNKLYFAYNGTTIASMDSSGSFITVNNITAYGTP